jgi:hypothetical protein
MKASQASRCACSELVEGAGHHLEIERPEMFVERVLRFLEE